jgi:predicted flap endonuclease-1-like 5' DNA nuclease
MDNRTLLVVFIVLVLTGVFLFIWRRRDRGEEPVDRLPEVLHEPLDGRSGSRPPLAEPTPIEAAPTEAPPLPSVPPAPTGPADDLTRMKGVGPKVATLLGELGITHYSQIAQLSDDDVAAIDQRLGVFEGRITRDRWVEQAGYLARGDIAGFEARFGKLGD